MSEAPIVGQVEPPTLVPKRPTLYALAALSSGKWTLSYAGQSRGWIEGSQQPLHPGSSLVVVPGEDDAVGNQVAVLANLIAARRALDLDMNVTNLAWHHHANAALDENTIAAEAVRNAAKRGA